jgi:hypothetical protein
VLDRAWLPHRQLWQRAGTVKIGQKRNSRNAQTLKLCHERVDSKAHISNASISLSTTGPIGVIRILALLQLLYISITSSRLIVGSGSWRPLLNRPVMMKLLDYCRPSKLCRGPSKLKSNLKDAADVQTL